MPTIRPSSDQDVPAITAIYAHHVLNGTGTFETVPPTPEDMAARRADVLSKDLRVMDASAISLMRENDIPIVVFSIRERGNLMKVLQGEGVHTVIAEAA